MTTRPAPGIDAALGGLDAARRAGWARAYKAESEVRDQQKERAIDLLRIAGMLVDGNDPYEVAGKLIQCAATGESFDSLHSREASDLVLYEYHRRQADR